MIGDIGLTDGGRGRNLASREIDPRDPKCPLHLRRICGTCTHFEGRLRQAAPAKCGKIGHSPKPQKRADACKFWARK